MTSIRRFVPIIAAVLLAVAGLVLLSTCSASQVSADGPQATRTPVPGIRTRVAPATATEFPTEVPTDTPEPPPTNTKVPPPTNTKVPPTDPPPTATDTPAPTDTATPPPTDTSTPLPTATGTLYPTDTPPPTATNTATTPPTATRRPKDDDEDAFLGASAQVVVPTINSAAAAKATTVAHGIRLPHTGGGDLLWFIGFVLVILAGLFLAGLVIFLVGRACGLWKRSPLA